MISDLARSRHTKTLSIEGLETELQESKEHTLDVKEKKGELDAPMLSNIARRELMPEVQSL